jgi:hypothetical protein
MPSIRLPTANGGREEYTLREAAPFVAPALPFNRVAYAAAHVAATGDPDEPIDWEATLAYRRYLWSLGLGVAEAMDTAQRGMGLGWSDAKELIRRTIEAARRIPGAQLVCGCGTDQLDAERAATIETVLAAYEEQIAFVEALGGMPVMMASRALASCARGADDYAAVYDRVLSQCRGKVILHWLGDMFDPQLRGYWGSDDLDAATEACLGIVARHAETIDGIKLSLLDKEREIAMRRRLPPGLRMYTGDDFDYPELIGGDEAGHSHALLGIFDAIAPAAAAALGALAAGDRPEFERILAPTLPLSRKIFEAPTRFYKTGVVFLAYLNGHQDRFVMLGGQQNARSMLHLADVFRLADQAGLLRDPESAAQRMGEALGGS